MSGAQAVAYFRSRCSMLVSFIESAGPRLLSFARRVSSKVPEQFRQEAPPEVARQVLEAVAFTDENSPLMNMFEELMAKATDARSNANISPQFCEIIKSLSPLEAVLLADLKKSEHFDIAFVGLSGSCQNSIQHFCECNYDPKVYGGNERHFTLAQMLEEKGLVTVAAGGSISDPQAVRARTSIPPHVNAPLTRLTVALKSKGTWLVEVCVASD